MLVPHRVAIALQDAGWIVRSDAVWSKPNPMPHPVKDRLNEHKEFVFHLTPEPDYWFDLDAVREPHAEASISRRERADSPRGGEETYGLPENTGIGDDDLHPNGKNPGDILNVSVKAFPEAHFAVYPPELCETPIKSSCPPKVCSECGTPWSRERTVDDREVKGGVSRIPAEQREHEHVKNFNQNDREGLTQPTDVSLGDWEPGCDCEAETEPGIVLDPFAGAGTTALVAKRLGRRFAGIDLNPEYVAMAQKRVGVTVDEPERLLEDGETALTAFTDGGSFQK
jgi:DNA modification methylase